MLNVLLLVFLSNVVVSYPLVETQPRHVHLALGKTSDSIIVTWSTIDQTPESVVLLYEDHQELEFVGTAREFVDGGEKHLSQWIHKVVMTKLRANHTYTYRVGSSLGWSDVLQMRTTPQGIWWSPKIAEDFKLLSKPRCNYSF